MSIKGHVDNGKNQTLENEPSDKVARGFFWKDLSYGFYSYDGFVIYYVKDDEKWYYKSLRFNQTRWDSADPDLDLTEEPSNLEWSCEVSAPKEEEDRSYNEVFCSREIPFQPDFKSLLIRYMPEVVVYAIGYHSDFTSFEQDFDIGGQVTL
jgi:hypothetical protein